MIDPSSIVDDKSSNFVDELVRRFRFELSVIRGDREMLRRDPRGIEAYVAMPTPPAMRDPLWRIKAVPSDLIDRRVEITGPAVDPKMALNALNSGAQGYMVDAEDSMSPTWDAVLRTQSTLTGISRRTLGVGDRRICDVPAVLHFRPRGLHLNESHWIVDGKPAPAALVDAGLFLYWNAGELIDRGSAPYLYLPKLETEHEAGFWDRLFRWVESRLRIDPGTIRCTVLIETLPALIRAEHIIWVLRERITGLNVGRWDYVLSLIRAGHGDSSYVLPDRAAIGMESPALSEYARWVVRVAHRRGAHAIGGMAADVPSRRDPVGAARALEAVSRDKEREVRLGHDGTWVAHPDLVRVALDVFHRGMEGRPEQRWNLPPGDRLDVGMLTVPPTGPRTEDGLREAVRTALVYMDAWLRGNGCVAVGGKMEDAATAEISRGLLWQWVARGALLDDGTRVDANRVNHVIRGEADALAAAGAEPLRETLALLCDSIFVPRPPDHILTAAYEVLVNLTLNR